MALGVSEKTGVGGWLGLLVFGMMIGAPLTAVISTASDFQSAEAANPGLVGVALWQQMKGVIWAFAFAQAGVFFFGGWRLLYRHVPRSVTYAMAAMWIGGPLLSVAALATVSAMAPSTTPGGAAGIAQPLIYAIVWSAYLSRSKRVKNTYYMGFGGEASGTPSTPRLPLRQRLRLDEAQRRQVFFAGAWVVLIFVFALLFDSEDEGFFADGWHRDWDKIFIWALVPPVLWSLGRFAYGRFVSPTHQDTQ